MATEAQTSANRVNSQKSTGPRTAEGKATVSQNAVKHGLFAYKALIYGEHQVDFDLHREVLLDEWRPVGATEYMLAERIVSLAWRLGRAERMESQSIDGLIIYSADSGRLTRTMLGREARERLGASGTLDRDLSLGQAIVKDFANYRVLDRLMLYERRIENSMYRTMNKLKQLQIMRRIEKEGADERTANMSPPADHKTSLKKQSQCAPDLMGATPYIRKDYENTASPDSEEDKAKQSQLPAFSRTAKARHPKFGATRMGAGQ